MLQSVAMRCDRIIRDNSGLVLGASPHRTTFYVLQPGRVIYRYFLCFCEMWPFSTPRPLVTLNDLHEEYDYVIVGALTS